jgi:hypothetical protein
MAWNKTLEDLVQRTVKEFGLDINFDALVDEAYALEEKNYENRIKLQLRQEIGLRLRKFALAIEPMLPNLLDGFVQKDGDYVHASQLSREDWLIRKYKIRARINTLLLREAAIDEVLSQDDLPEEGIV